MYTADQRIVIVETYAKCREKFICRYPDSSLLTKSYMSKFIKKWQTTGSFLDKT
jgi:hypothetical protein